VARRDLHTAPSTRFQLRIGTIQRQTPTPPHLVASAIATISRLRCEHQFSGKVLHTVDVGDRHIDLFAPDHRGADLTNAWLRGADLSGANLESAILLRADLTESCPRNANLRNLDARYCDFTRADLREAILENVDVYPSQVFKTHFCGARMTSGSDVEQYAQIAQEENWNRAGIKPGSVAYRKLRGINGRTRRFAGFSTKSKPRYRSGENVVRGSL
jgi:uncharacterized protein YjbI with pentapeptide repeats